jgi:hypothetical protein
MLFFGGVLKVVLCPNHPEIKISTLAGLLKQAGVSVDEFISATNA